MAFLSVTLKNFRNLQDQELDLSYPEVFLIGQNAQGKTNLLEALYILAYGNSFRTKSDVEMYKTGNQFYYLSALYKESSNLSHTVTVHSKNRKKEIAKNAKRISDRKVLVSTIPCIIFCHDDISFANGEMARRRFFLDQTLSLYNYEYIETLRNYNKILKTRNTVLKEKRFNLLDTLDLQLAHSGLEIIALRKKLVAQLNEIFTDYYFNISGIQNVRLEYRTSWTFESATEVAAFLLEKRQRDIDFSTTMSGPQRDKLYYLCDGKLFVPKASTGQIRLISLVLRSVQAHCYFKQSGRKPVLLLDDVLLELDPDKKAKFTQMLPSYEQLFCTFLPGEPIANYKKEKTCVYYVEEGAFKK